MALDPKTVTVGTELPTVTKPAITRDTLKAYGPAAGGQTVLWVNFADAISLHPVVTANRSERRQERLDSPEADDNRITYGCINVPADFYDKVVRRTFTGTKGVVYVLPETQPLDEVFPALRLEAPRVAAAPPPLPLSEVQESTIRLQPTDAPSAGGAP